MIELLQEFSAKEYLNVLPSTSREYVTGLVENGADPIQLAHTMSLEPGEGLSTKSGEIWPKDILPRLLQEVHIFVCTEELKYKETRDKLKGEAITSANVIVYLISNAVAIHAGMAAALCVPLVALILASIAKIGLATWCKAFTQQSQTPIKTG